MWLEKTCRSMNGLNVYGKYAHLVIQSGLFVMVKWSFQGVKWPPTRDEKGTLNHLAGKLFLSSQLSASGLGKRRALVVVWFFYVAKTTPQSVRNWILVVLITVSFTHTIHGTDIFTYMSCFGFYGKKIFHTWSIWVIVVYYSLIIFI